MHLMDTIVKLLSPLRSMFADNPTQNLTELLSTDAITADLNPLVEIQADLSKFGQGIEILFNKHFPADYLIQQDQHDHWSVTVLRQNQALLTESFGTTYDPNLPPCVLAPGVIHHCENPAPHPTSFRALLEAETARTRACATTSISPASNAMFALASGWLDDNYELYWLDFNAWTPESAQEFEFGMRFWAYWQELLGLKTRMAEAWTCERVDYLWRLERVYLEVGARDGLAGADFLDGGVGFDDEDWAALDAYWGALYREARRSVGDGAGWNSSVSLLPVMLEELTFW
jgi:hypothetical protein